MAKKVTTLYIDDLSVRLLVTRNKEVSKWAYAPLKPGLVENAVILDEDGVASTIKEILEAQKVTARRVDVAVSGLLCLTRAITLPQLPKAMLDEAVVREARKTMPLAMENLYGVNWQIIPNARNQTYVFMVAVRRKTIDALIRTLNKAGLKIRFLDLKPLALSRVVTEKTAIILDVQPNEFDIVVMVGGVPQPIRTFPFPPDIKSVQDKLKLLVEQTESTLKFYNSHNAESALPSSTTVFVSGELLSEPQLQQVLSEQLGHPVKELPSPLKYPDNFNLGQFMANIGLALKELPQVKKTGLSVAKLNALPLAYQPESFSWTRVIVVTAMLLCALGTVPLFMLVQAASTNLEAMQKQLDMTNQLINQRQIEKQGVLKDIAELKDRLAQAEASRNAFAQVFTDLSDQSSRVNGDVATASSLLPDSVTLGTINHDGQTMKISGRAPGEDQILLYASSLRDSARFAQIVVAAMTRSEDGFIDFVLILKSGK